MLFIFASRSRPRDDRHLRVRVALMCVGAGLGLGGMLLGPTWLIWIALTALLAGLILRSPRGQRERNDEERVRSGRDEERARPL